MAMAVLIAMARMLGANLGEPITIVALIGAASTLLSALFAAWAAVKQRRTEDVKLGYEAMREALNNYRTDNLDLRKRVTEAEQRMYTAELRMFDLTAKVDRCESDKAVLSERVAHQNEKIVELERRANGA